MTAAAFWWPLLAGFVLGAATVVLYLCAEGLGDGLDDGGDW